MSKEKISDKLIEYLNKADNFFSDEVPAVIKETIEYYQWEMKFTFKILAGLFIGGVLMFSGGLYYYINNPSEYPSANLGFLPMIVSIFPIVLGPVIGSGIYYDYKMLKTAPKLFLLRKIRGV